MGYATSDAESPRKVSGEVWKIPTKQLYKVIIHEFWRSTALEPEVMWCLLQTWEVIRNDSYGLEWIYDFFHGHFEAQVSNAITNRECTICVGSKTPINVGSGFDATGLKANCIDKICIGSLWDAIDGPFVSDVHQHRTQNCATLSATTLEWCIGTVQKVKICVELTYTPFDTIESIFYKRNINQYKIISWGYYKHIMYHELQTIEIKPFTLSSMYNESEKMKKSSINSQI